MAEWGVTMPPLWLPKRDALPGLSELHWYTGVKKINNVHWY